MMEAEWDFGENSEETTQTHSHRFGMNTAHHDELPQHSKGYTMAQQLGKHQ